MSEFTTPFEMINRTNAIKSHANLEDWNLNENGGSTSITRVDGQVMVADFEVSADLDEHRIDGFMYSVYGSGDLNEFMYTGGDGSDSVDAVYAGLTAEIMGWLDEA